MGCVYNRGTKSSPNFWIRWKDRSGRKQYAGVGPDRQLAKAALRKKEHEVDAKRFDLPTEPPPPIPLFNEAADAWIKMRSAIGADGQPAFRSWRDDQTRLKVHLRTRFGKRRLDEVTEDDVRALIEKMRPTHKPQTIRNTLHTLSRLFEDQPKALRLVNPVRQLGRSDRQHIGAAWDPTATPWLQSKDHIRRLYEALPEMAEQSPWRPMYAVGALAGLRPGEIRSLRWGDLDFAGRLIHVQRSDDGPTKDGESRPVPLSDALAGVLLEWKDICPAPPDSPPAACFRLDGHPVHKDDMQAMLTAAFATAELVRLTWYQATRHTYGGQFVSNGGSLEKLRVILGHSSTEVTQRYGHLVRGQFTDLERGLADVQLRPGKVLPLRGRRGA